MPLRANDRIDAKRGERQQHYDRNRRADALTQRKATTETGQQAEDQGRSSRSFYHTRQPQFQNLAPKSPPPSST